MVERGLRRSRWSLAHDERGHQPRRHSTNEIFIKNSFCWYLSCIKTRKKSLLIVIEQHDTWGLFENHLQA